MQPEQDIAEQNVAEIRALANALGQSTRAVLERVREARSEVVAGDPLIAFVHIPKTAGATVISMFAAAYSRTALHNAGNYLKAGPEGTAEKLSRRPGGWESWSQRGGRLTAGHVPYALFREHLPADTRYMTFLREPIDLVLSYYYRHVHRREDFLDDRRPLVADSIEEALEMRRPELSDLATRLLCGRPSLGPVPASGLEEAKENLRNFDFVGIQERFEESVALLQSAFGVGLTPYLNRHVNYGRRLAVDEIPDEQRALIAEHNQLDAELYTFARELFEDAVGAADQGFAADVKRLRALTEERHETAMHRAREWLDHELPVGSAKPRAELFAAAEAAGVAPEAFKELLNLSGKREFDHEGRIVWTRAEDGRPA